MQLGSVLTSLCLLCHFTINRGHCYLKSFLAGLPDLIIVTYMDFIDIILQCNTPCSALPWVKQTIGEQKRRRGAFVIHFLHSLSLIPAARKPLLSNKKWLPTRLKNSNSKRNSETPVSLKQQQIVVAAEWATWAGSASVFLAQSASAEETTVETKARRKKTLAVWGHPQAVWIQRPPAVVFPTLQGSRFSASGCEDSCQGDLRQESFWHPEHDPPTLWNADGILSHRTAGWGWGWGGG